MEERNIGCIAGGIVATIAGGLFLSFCSATRVNERQAAIKVTSGTVVDENVKPGWNFGMPFFTNYIKYPTTLQTVTIDTGGNDGPQIRTAEKVRIGGKMVVQFRIDPNKPGRGKLYTDLKVTDGDDLGSKEQLGDDFGLWGLDVLQERMPKFSIDTVTSKPGVVGVDLRKSLQKQIDQPGYPIDVRRIYMAGIGLSPEANRLIEASAMKDQEVKIAAKDLQINKMNEDAAAGRGEVVSAFISKLPEGSRGQAASLWCLESQRTAGAVGRPGAASGFSAGDSFVPK